ncbi:MAG: S8 family serine peptidase [Candidatus Aureabacteria bacterium]|nr:S8 family serine peptidase [Candidatus Auribacterota bacterium]
MKTQIKFFKSSAMQILGMGALLFFLFSPSAASPQNAPYVKGEILVKYKSHVSSLQMKNIEHAAAAAMREDLPSPGLKRVKISPTASVEDAIDDYYNRAGDSIEYAEPNYIVTADVIPNDPEFSNLWNLRNTGQSSGTAGADIDAPGAWDTQTGGSVIVAVIDTGVDYTHPDLAANIWINSKEIPGNGIDDDKNGFVDDCRGWDFVNSDNDPYDDHSHGTHVSGTIAAVGNNGIGVAGVCWQAKIMPLKFLAANGGGTVADAIKAIHYATMMGAKVMSNSWGGGGYSQALKDAIDEARNAGAIFVAAAGNSGTDNDAIPHYPSSYDCANLIAVAATDNNDQIASFSCYGAISVDIGAPGVAILSTVPGGYASYSGTSMATPHVAGAVALTWARFPTKSYAEIISAILGGAEPISSLNGKVATSGRLNLLQAINPENDTTPPAAVTDLSVSETRMSRATLRWTATGDDGNEGAASSYDLRYSRAPISDANWDSASRFPCAASPMGAGTVEEATVGGLLPSTQYYFVLKVKDNRGNTSGLSNSVSATTKDGAVMLDDSVENGDNGWAATGLWHRSGNRSSSPSSSWYYGQEGSWTYDTGDTSKGTLTSQEVDLSSYEDALLTFSYYRQVESYGGSYDITSVDASKDGGSNWTTVWLLDSSTPNAASWADSGAVMLSSFAGAKVRLRFSFDSVDGTNNQFEGWYVDNIRVVAEDYAGSGGVGGDNLYMHSVKLTVNKQRFQSGNILSLYGAVKRGALSPYTRCSAYVAVSLPAGNLLFLTKNGTFSAKAATIADNFTVSDMSATIGSFTIPPGLAGGTYTWMAVLSQPQKSAVKTSSWVSNLSEAPFIVNR